MCSLEIEHLRNTASMLSAFIAKIKASDSDLSQVILGSGITMIMKVIGALLSLVVTILLSQSLGGYGFGVYSLAFSILMLSSNIARFGLDNAILKFAGTAYKKADWQSIQGLYRLSLLWVTLSCTLIAIILYLSADFIALNIFDTPELVLIIKYLGLVILPLALFNIYISFFLAKGAVTQSAILAGIVVPTLMIIGIIIFATNELTTPHYMIMLYGLNCGLNLLACYFLYRKIAKPQQAGAFSSSLLFSTCVPLFLTVVAEYLAIHAPQLILGSYWSPEEVANFSVCLRIATLISFILTSASRVIAPRLAALHDNNQPNELAELASKVTTIMFICSSLISLTIYLFAEQLLSLFGESFIDAKMILQIFALSQLILVINGLGRIVLQMSSNLTLSKNISFINVGLIVTFSMVFIPQYSSLGAVLSLLTASFISTVITVIVIKKQLGFYLLSFAWLNPKKLRAR